MCGTRFNSNDQSPRNTIPLRWQQHPALPSVDARATTAKKPVVKYFFILSPMSVADIAHALRSKPKPALRNATIARDVSETEAPDQLLL